MKKLLEMLIAVPEGPRCKERIMYAEAVVQALNDESPKIVAKLNLLSFQEELKLVCFKRIYINCKYSCDICTTKGNKHIYNYINT